MWIKHPPGTFLREGETAVDMMDVWGDLIEEVQMPYETATAGPSPVASAIPRSCPREHRFAFTFRER